MRHCAFTLVELLVVVVVLVALMAISIPTAAGLAGRWKADECRALVAAVAAAIQDHDVRRLVVHEQGGSRQATVPMFDWNGDLLLDPDPASGLDGGPAAWSQLGWIDAAELQAIGYRGFLATTGLQLPKGALVEGRVVDPWDRPLRIAWAGVPYPAGSPLPANHAAGYGAAAMGVWSLGPDGIAGTADDICSWRSDDDER